MPIRWRKFGSILRALMSFGRSCLPSFLQKRKGRSQAHFLSPLVSPLSPSGKHFQKPHKPFTSLPYLLETIKYLRGREREREKGRRSSFHSREGEGERDREIKEGKKKGMAIQFPDDFKCPISLEIMSDPVILSSGHTFDRASIQRWLDSGNRTCPISKLPLSDHPPLIPNHALRSLISNYTLLPPPKLHPAQSPPSEPQTLVSTLTSSSSPLDAKLNSLSQLAKLTKFEPVIRRQLTESGAASAVLGCVNSPDSALQEKALSLLLNLSLDDDNKVGLVAEGAIGRVVTVLRLGSPDCRAIGCTILTSLAVVEVNKATIGAYPNAIQVLVNLLAHGKGREVKEAATALYAICSFPGNRRRAVECGAVPMLVRISEMGLERAVEVLSLLVKCKEGREEMARESGVVAVLLKVVRNGSERGVQCALFTLNCLCSYREEICGEAMRQGVLELCVGLVEDENEKIRRNASSLLRTLSGSHSME